MPEPEQLHETALRSANLALSGRKSQDPSPLAAVELEFDDPQTGAWELAALASVAVAAALLVVGLWFW